MATTPGITESPGSPWLVDHFGVDASASASPMPLVCFPYAGAGPSIYRQWSEQLGPEIAVIGIHLPGRGTRLREPPIPVMETLVTELVPALVTALAPHTGTPYAFLGQSLGALIAFETVRELRRQGVPLPCCLVVASEEGPRVPDPDPPVHEMSDDDMVAEMNRRYDAIPRDLLEEPALLDLLLPALRGDMALTERHVYREEPPLTLPLFAFGGRDDTVSESDLRAWSDETRGPFHWQMFPGGHFFLQEGCAPAWQAVKRAVLETASRSDDATEPGTEGVRKS